MRLRNMRNMRLRNMRFAEYALANPHSRNSGFVETSKPRTPSTPVIDTSKYQGEGGEGLQASTTPRSRLHCPRLFAFIIIFVS